MRDTDRAREIILQYGWNTTCYQILSPGIQHWFSSRTDAVIGYVCRGKYWLVAGAPVCSLDDLDNVIAEFRSFTNSHKICFVGAEQRLTSWAEQNDRARVSLGAQPIWTAADFLRRYKSHGSLREQSRRAKAKGVVVREVEALHIAEHPELEEVLSAWLASKPIPNMQFLVEPNVFGSWGDRRLFVAEQKGRSVGFVVLCPIPKRDGWLTEDFIRAPWAPNGTIELGLWHAISAISETGDEFVTMGMCPLAMKAELTPQPWWLSLHLNFAKKFGQIFYNFRGLEFFKNKFEPDDWEPVTVVTLNRHFHFGDMIAIVGAFTGYHPFLMPFKFLARRMKKPRP